VYVKVVHLCTGLCPDWEDWNADGQATAHATEAMDAAEQWLDVPQVRFFVCLFCLSGVPFERGCEREIFPKSRYFAAIGSSSVQTLADMHKHATSDKHWCRDF